MIGGIAIDDWHDPVGAGPAALDLGDLGREEGHAEFGRRGPVHGDRPNVVEVGAEAE